MKKIVIVSIVSLLLAGCGWILSGHGSHTKSLIKTQGCIDVTPECTSAGGE